MDRIEEDRQVVVNSLREAGVQVSDVYDLVNGKTPRAAIPVLIDVLPLLDSNVIKEGVIRALGDKAARGVALEPLITELRKIGATKPLLGWTIANSIAEIADVFAFEPLRELVHDVSLGKAREMLVLAIANTKHPDAIAELSKLTHDETLTGHLVMALGELRASPLRPFIEQQLNHRQGWVRKEAKRALSRLT